MKDIDTALNQRGDDIAAVMTRADKLEAQTIKVPRFFVKCSANGQNIASNTWALLGAGSWGSVVQSVGGFTWGGGVLTVPRAGWYQVISHVHYYDTDYGSCGVQVTRNTTAVDTAATVSKDEWWAEVQTNSLSLNPSVRSVANVALNAGDTLRMFTYQRNRNNDVTRLGKFEFDQTVSVTWNDSL